MRQRLGVADTLVKDPDVVILDEPTTAIDPEGVVEILALISRLAHKDGRAVLISSHLLNQVQQVCDRVGIFVDGRIVAQGTPDELAASLSEGSSVYEFVVEATEEQVKAAVRAGFPELSDDAVSVTETGPSKWRVALPERDISGVVRAMVEADLEVKQIRDLGSNLDEIYQALLPRGTRRWPHDRGDCAGDSELAAARPGWVEVARKEFTDHLLSVRFFILLLILGLVAVGTVYGAAGALQEAAQEASTSGASVFLRLFTVRCRPDPVLFHRDRGVPAPGVRDRLRVRLDQR